MTKSGRQVDQDFQSGGEAWLAYVWADSRAQALEQELALMRRSRSWALTAPLRAVMRYAMSPPWASSRAARPKLRAPEGLIREDLSAQLPLEIPRVFLDSLRRDNSRANLYIDVTALELEDLGAGIQKVTRQVLAGLLVLPRPQFTVVPVCLRSDGAYHEAQRFLEAFLGVPAGVLGPEAKISPRPGEVLLALDLCREYTDALYSAWKALRSEHVGILPLLYDCLPITRPEWFPSPVPLQLKRWLEIVSAQANHVLCISEATRASAEKIIRDAGWRLPQLSVIPMGCDGVRNSIARGIAAEAHPPRILMVGTIEPRKGYAQVVDAFERLWSRGEDLQLIIVGRLGWKVDQLVKRLTKKSRSTDRLQWLSRADDETLHGLYLSSHLLLGASEGEGFGLPVVEAAAAGCKLLLRDIPVFHEIAGANARYFNDADGLESALASFIRDPSSWPRPPERSTLPSWSDTTRAVLACAARLSTDQAPDGVTDQ